MRPISSLPSRYYTTREFKEGVKTNVTPEKLHSNHHKTPTGNALLSQDGTRFSSTGNQVKWAYCGGAHFSASCETVSDPKARLEILRRDVNLFVSKRILKVRCAKRGADVARETIISRYAGINCSIAAQSVSLKQEITSGTAAFNPREPNK